MFRFSIFVAILALAFSAGSAEASALPDEVQKHIDDMRKSCRELGATPIDPEKGFLVSADLNGDGISDWAIDEGKFQCDGAWSAFSGSGGAQVYVYTGLPGNKARQAFVHGANGMRLERNVGRARLWLGVGGPLCGQAHPISNADAIPCERPLVWNKVSNKFEFAPLSTIKLIRQVR
jgi:hypothetical protein